MMPRSICVSKLNSQLVMYIHVQQQSVIHHIFVVLRSICVAKLNDQPVSQLCKRCLFPRESVSHHRQLLSQLQICMMRVAKYHHSQLLSQLQICMMRVAKYHHSQLLSQPYKHVRQWLVYGVRLRSGRVLNKRARIFLQITSSQHRQPVYQSLLLSEMQQLGSANV